MPLMHRVAIRGCSGMSALMWWLQDSMSMLARMFDANWAGKNKTDDKV